MEIVNRYNSDMCTSIVVNKSKTIVGFNFDNPGWKYKIFVNSSAFYIAVLADVSFWDPIIGCNFRGDFVNLPGMNPGVKDGEYVEGRGHFFIDRENAKVLMGKRTFMELAELVKTNPIINEPGCSLQAQDSDAEGNVLQIFPGLGYRFISKPAFSVLTNFQLMNEEKEHHPWAGVDRYDRANQILKYATADFGVKDMFAILKAVCQPSGGAPTAVSLVFDVTKRTIYWCENREWGRILSRVLTSK